MERLASLDKLPALGARVGFALCIVAFAIVAIAYVSSMDHRTRVTAVAARFDETGLRSIAADPANAAAFDQAIDRICGRRYLDQCVMLDRAGVLARWGVIRREAALANAFEIEIDRLTRGAPQ